MKRDKRSPVAACSCWRASAPVLPVFRPAPARSRRRRPDVPGLRRQRQRRQLQPRLDPDHRRRAQPGVVAGRRRSTAPRGFARVQFDSIKVELALPLGWQATEDWERGVGYSGDKRYRLIIWRVDFAFEGVKDAEHYAATKTGAIQARRPSIQAQARKLGDGTFLIVYENAPKGQGDSEQRTVFDLVMQRPGNPKEGVLMTLGVPASDAERGMKLMALLKQNMRINW